MPDGFETTAAHFFHLPVCTEYINNIWKLKLHFKEKLIGFKQSYCEAQARVRQGSARDGHHGERPQSFNPCLELTLKLVVTHPPPEVYYHLTNGQMGLR